jgi:hypothetical protein
LERGVRQLLADKVSGTLVGIWFLVPEHLRLGTWDLLTGWTRQPGDTVAPRLALQLVQEAALCVPGLRESRSLTQKGFELANGLPFLATDQAVHELLNAHTVAEAQALQLALGQIRQASGHYQGMRLAIDPHHLRSFTQRQTRRHRHREDEPAVKTLQTFFCLDTDTGQPVAFTTGSSSRTVTQGTIDLLHLVTPILRPRDGETILLADKEHFSVELFRYIVEKTPFHFVTPIPNSPPQRRRMEQIPPEAFLHRWAGLATAKLPFQFSRTDGPALHQIVQRGGEQSDAYELRAFLSTHDCDELQLLIEDYPARWHVEEFFRANQALGWNRGGTLNLHIRYGQMTLALLAQAAIHQLRRRLGEPFLTWDAAHLAKSLFQGIDGDLRVTDDTILVTLYNPPNAQQLRHHYEHLPHKLAHEGVDPHIPWLYNFKLDFRFR